MNQGQRLPAQAFAAVVSHDSKKSQKGRRTLKPTNNYRDRGRRSSARRPNIYRQSKNMKQQRNNKNSSNNKNDSLHSDEVRELLSRRNNRNDDLSASEIAELMEQANADKSTAGLEKVEASAACKPTASEVNAKAPLYGTLQLHHKDPDAIRVMSLNLNGIHLWGHNNVKAERLKNLLKQSHTDVLGIQEHHINFAAYPSSKTIASTLRHGSDDICSIQAHNTRETKNIGHHQRGGTAVVVREQLTGFIVDRGKDEKGLGMYAWYTTEGKTGVRTTFISAYAPSKSEEYGSYYQHIERYIQEKRLQTNPKDLFRTSIIGFIQKRSHRKHQMVLMMDSNENVTDGHLSKRLAEECRLREAVHRAMPGRKGPPTHISNSGSKKSSGSIDGIWISDDIELMGASYLPFDKVLGDHRPVVVDIHMRSVLGTLLHRIVRPKARRLNSRVKRHRDRYLHSVKEGFQNKKIEQMIGSLEGEASFPPSQVVIDKLEKLDNLVEEIMLQAERGCRKLFAAHYEFSPEVQNWMDRCHLLKWLLRAHQGKRTNRGNLRRLARKLGMTECLRYTVPELVKLYAATKERAVELMAASPYLRKQYLHQRLHDAIENGRDDEAKYVQNIIRGEAQRKVWQGIKRTVKGTSHAAVVRVEVPQADGSVIECTTKEAVEKAIMDELSTRFGRAESAPICQGALFDLLGVYADTNAAMQILEGTFEPPAGTDAATIILLEEIARIWEKVGEGEVNIVVTQEDYQYYWRRVKEKISSSFSGLHFGHYKAIAHDDYLSDLLARKLSLIAATGSAPERWARGLSVMLEKIAGVALVTKLRGILLLEADFNFHNKLIFGSRMMDLARENGLVPTEIYSEKGRTAEDAILQQVLLYDIARVTKRPLVVASVDAAQCYDRVALAMAALTLRAFKVHNSSVLGMLRPLHCMEFYLRTGFGHSDTFFGGSDEGKHGLAQGNGAAPPTWQQICTLMINAQHRRGHGIEVICPITLKSIRQVGVDYVDDCNLWGGLDESDDLETAAAKSQDGITSWGNLLRATGGALQPGKCSATAHHMVPDGKGGWVYSDQGKEYEEAGLEELDGIQFEVPQGEGESAPIKRLPTNQAVENLGIFARPDGNPDAHFAHMREKMTDWTAKIKNGSIPTRSVWMSYTHQLWSGLRYGLGACSASLPALRSGLGSADYYILSNLGVVRSITREWRYLPATFGGMELFELPIETTAATISSFLQHYSTGSQIDIALTAAMQYLQLEIGVDRCPFEMDFTVWGPLATDTWVKALWEKIDHYGLILDMDYPTIPLPRENDALIMQKMVDLGIRGAELKRINRVRITQEALFLSDITTPNGRSLEEQLLHTDWSETEEGALGRHRSRLKFWLELPTATDWKTWEKRLKEIASPSLRLDTPLGAWKAPSTRIWRYLYDPDNHLVEVHSDEEIAIYEYDVHSSAMTNVLTHTRVVSEGAPNTVPVEIRRTTGSTIKLLRSQSSPLRNETPPEVHTLTFAQRLKAKGGEWMWDKLQFKQGDDPGWMVEAILNESLYIVTDGSHIPNLAKDICGAAFIFYCAVTKNWLRGEFAEESESADSYRGEQLGMLAIHIILLTLEEHCEGMEASSNLFCDNKGTIQTFSKNYQRVPSNAKNSDVLRVLRRIQSMSKLRHKLKHVKGHQDDILRNIHSLDLEAHLNIDCDRRAKRAVATAVHQRKARRDVIYRLPLEAAALYIEGEKQTTDIASSLRYHIGKAKARQFYIDENIMDGQTFDSVTWEDLRHLLARRPKMYQIWLSKQSSGFCGTGVMLRRWDKNESGMCPNCGIPETAAHLNRCRNKIRLELLSDSLNDLSDWLKEHHTHPELLMWLPLYIQQQDRLKFVDLRTVDGDRMSQQMRQVAHSLDKIGWQHVTEGKLSNKLRAFQGAYLQTRALQITIDHWMRGLIDQLLTLSHTQWLCRNLTKHHKTKGAKALATKAELRQEIELLLDLGSDGLPEHSKCLLEISPDELFALNTSNQQHWVNANNAARMAADENFVPVTAAVEPVTPRYSGAAQPTSEKVATFHCGTPFTGNRKVAPLFHKKQPNRRIATGTSPQLPQSGRRRPTPLRLDILRRNTEQEVQESKIIELLNQPLHTTSSKWHLQFPTSEHRSGLVKHSSLKTLNPGIWLNDEVMNCYLRRVLNPAINNSNTYFFNSYFMSTLLQTGEDGRDEPTYTFDAVSRWGRSIRRDGGLLGMRDLFVPINRQNMHWLFIHVEVNTLNINLWDSMGRHEYNSIYLSSMLRYLGDLFREVRGEDPTEWMARWTVTDCSDQSPVQHNSYDCGVFSLTSITLLAQKAALSPRSYTEADLQTYNTRQRIAYLLWKASTNQPQPRRSSTPRPRRTTPQSASSSSSSAPLGKRPRKQPAPKPSTAGSSTTKARNKRRRQNNNQRVTVGSSRPHGIVTSRDIAPSMQLAGIVNRKRSAESVAKGDASTTPTTQRHAPPKKKKRLSLGRLK